MKAYCLIELFSIIVFGADYFEGSVMIDGMAHTLSCSCDQPVKTEVLSPADLPYINPSVCETISTTTIVEEKALPTDAGLSADDVSENFGQPRQIQISNDPTAEFQCADARWTTEQAFTLGGDLGEFLLATSAIDGLTSTPLNTEAIGQALLSWLQLGRTLTFCTDRASVTLINSQLGKTVDLNSPPESITDSILSAMSQNSELQGDVLWKCIVGSPANYKIRKDLIKAFLNGFFQIHWAKDRVVSSSIKIQNGDHKPVAVIRNDEKPNCEQFPIKIAPTQLVLGGGTITTLIYNARSIALRRREIIAHLIQSLAVDLDKDKILDIVTHDAQELTERCISESFQNVPIYGLELL